MLFFSQSITPRLQYSCDFIAKELTGEPFVVTSDENEFIAHEGAKINYSPSRLCAAEFYLRPHTLLFEKTIEAQRIECEGSKEQTIFFVTEGDIAFDIFAASFYLLSRYEEYLPHQLDSYGRYDHANSLAFRAGFLQIPLINYWLIKFKALLQEKFDGIIWRDNKFMFLPTYDIDMARTYKHKGWWRNAGGLLRSFLLGQWKDARDRIAVLNGKQQDKYDSFEWMHQLHQQYQLKPYYFFLLADNPGKYDKNISPSNKAMQQLIREHITRYPVGIHPSWQSGDDLMKLKNEIANLSRVSGNIVRASRQHFIRMKMPDTYRKLEEHSIQFDFSMGYGGINGFRASFTNPFGWYDLKAERSSSLLLFPFCYMEATSFYELHHDAKQALAEMEYYYGQVKKVEGMFSMIWHNSFLGTDKLHEGWREMYAFFIAKLGDKEGNEMKGC